MWRSLEVKLEGPETFTTTKSNISKEEAQALAELRRYQSRVILAADKGVALVVLDKAEYNIKAQDLLKDAKT